MMTDSQIASNDVAVKIVGISDKSISQSIMDMLHEAGYTDVVVVDTTQPDESGEVIASLYERKREPAILVSGDNADSRREVIRLLHSFNEPVLLIAGGVPETDNSEERIGYAGLVGHLSHIEASRRLLNTQGRAVASRGSVVVTGGNGISDMADHIMAAMAPVCEDILDNRPRMHANRADWRRSMKNGGGKGRR